jgi:hypothetical protein
VSKASHLYRSLRFRPHRYPLKLVWLQDYLPVFDKETTPDLWNDLELPVHEKHWHSVAKSLRTEETCLPWARKRCDRPRDPYETPGLRTDRSPPSKPRRVRFVRQFRKYWIRKSDSSKQKKVLKRKEKAVDGAVLQPPDDSQGDTGVDDQDDAPSGPPQGPTSDGDGAGLSGAVGPGALHVNIGGNTGPAPPAERSADRSPPQRSSSNDKVQHDCLRPSLSLQGKIRFFHKFEDMHFIVVLDHSLSSPTWPASPNGLGGIEGHRTVRSLQTISEEHEPLLESPSRSDRRFRVPFPRWFTTWPSTPTPPTGVLRGGAGTPDELVSRGKALKALGTPGLSLNETDPDATTPAPPQEPSNETPEPFQTEQQAPNRPMIDETDPDAITPAPPKEPINGVSASLQTDPDATDGETQMSLEPGRSSDVTVASATAPEDARFARGEGEASTLPNDVLNTHGVNDVQVLADDEDTQPLIAAAGRQDNAVEPQAPVAEQPSQLRRRSTGMLTKVLTMGSQTRHEIMTSGPSNATPIAPGRPAPPARPAPAVPAAPALPLAVPAPHPVLPMTRGERLRFRCKIYGHRVGSFFRRPPG